MAAMMNVNDAWQTFTAQTGEKYYYTGLRLKTRGINRRLSLTRKSVDLQDFKRLLRTLLINVFWFDAQVTVIKDVYSSKPASSTAIPGTPWCVFGLATTRCTSTTLRSKPRVAKTSRALQSSRCGFVGCHTSGQFRAES
uniref:Uncharacterized protein n=1 Tax=Ditylenchus dipsaci TaxID=166011 RepID=A0A915DBD4_9BILA